MELLQLRYFCDAAHTENFSKTAKKYRVPASNISQCIKRLEKELGTQLFVRNHNSISLSTAGRRFLQKVSSALSLIDSGTEEIRNINKKHISICSLTNRQLVMNVTEKFLTLYPDVSVEISHAYDDSTVYDMIIADGDFVSDTDSRALIITEKIALAINLDNPLCNKAFITADDLKYENFISLNLESSLGKTADKICKAIGLEPNIIICSPDPFYVRKCVELNLGISFVPTYSWSNQFSDNVVIKEFGSFIRETYAYYRSESNMYAKKLLSLLTENRV